MKAIEEARERLASYVAQSRDKRGRRWNANTMILVGGGWAAVQLHATDVLVFDVDGSVVLNSGGWRTLTTKARMNEFLPVGFRVYQKRGAWYLTDGACVYGFEDGMRIWADGSVHSYSVAS